VLKSIEGKMSIPSRKHILSLYRNLLRNANKMDNYNFRHHAVRKIRKNFRDNKFKNSEDVGEDLSYGNEMLQLIIRQSTISQLYPIGKSIMDHKT
jgi:hypothetical protein